MKNSIRFTIKAVLPAILILSFLLPGCGKKASTDKKDSAPSSEESATNESTDTSAAEKPADAVNDTAKEEPGAEESADNKSAAAGSESSLIIPYISHQYIDRADGRSVLFYSRYDLLNLGGSASDFPKLEKVLSEINADKTENAEREADAYESEAKAFRDDTEIEEPFYTVQRTYVNRADEEILSFVSRYEDYLGGAHGSNSTTGYNYYTSSGEAIPLSDVIRDTDLLKDILAAKLELKYPDNSWFDDLSKLLSSYGSEYEFNWVLENQGITFIFNPYELAPYADGQQYITISYAESPGLFTEKIKSNDGSYVSAFTYYDDISIFDENGRVKPLSIYPEYDYEIQGLPGEYPLKSLEIRYDGKSLMDTEAPVYFAHEIEIYLVHTSDQKNYIYADCFQDNDWHSVMIYELGNDGNIKKAGEYEGHVDFTSTDEIEWGWHAAVFNPEKFELISRTDMFSTVSITRYYRVGKNGMPEPMTDYYTITSDISLKSTRPLRARYLGETEDLGIDAPKVSGDERVVTLPAGTGFRLWRTDAEAYADCVVKEDGKNNVYRLIQEIDNDYNRMIDGVNIEDCFEELFWAG